MSLLTCNVINNVKGPNHALHHLMLSENDVTLCIKIDKPLVVYIFSTVMMPIVTLYIYDKILVVLRDNRVVFVAYDEKNLTLVLLNY